MWAVEGWGQLLVEARWGLGLRKRPEIPVSGYRVLASGEREGPVNVVNATVLTGLTLVWED